MRQKQLFSCIKNIKFDFNDKEYKIMKLANTINYYKLIYWPWK